MKIKGLVKHSVTLLLLFISLASFAQKGIINGVVTDKKSSETLIAVTIGVYSTDGTSLLTGTTTGIDGSYSVKVTPGSYLLKISYISYETIEVPVTVQSDEVIVKNFQLASVVEQIEGVEIVTRVNRESENILLLEQKKSEGITESIGAVRLAKLGVSDAAAATTKISGVTKSEGSGDIYIRGLGDRYLITTMNGLPIPSDNIDKKNIDLKLLSTDVIKNVSISKTYDAASYGDMASGSVNIVSKTFSDKINIDISTGSNTNLFSNSMFSNFMTTQNMNDASFGFYNRPYTLSGAVQNQSWNTLEKSLPLDFGLAISGGKKFELAGGNLRVFATLGYDNSFDYQEGSYKEYRSNVLDESFTDATEYKSSYNTTGLINLEYDTKNKYRFNFSSLYINKTEDILYESGRNLEGYVFDQDPKQEEAFVRDQNTKVTSLSVNQLSGHVKFSDFNTLKWAVGYNIVNSDEPNRIRNEVNIYEDYSQFSHVGDYQQRKGLQFIEDNEINAYIKDEHKFIDEDEKKFKVNYGVNFRRKTRDFVSQKVGVRAKGVTVESFDDVDEALINSYNYNNNIFRVREGLEDLYSGLLNVYAGYISANYEHNKISGIIGLRYERDQLDVSWDVGNYISENGVPRIGETTNTFDNLFPSLNLKYKTTEKSALRLAASRTITLPEFKEMSPFEYVYPTGRVVKGNPELMPSTDYNVDLKWELFPTVKELVSVTTFYKMIQDPINLALTRGSSGYFFYANTGERANVFGIEAEARIELIESKEEAKSSLFMVLNGTKMWFNQDLLEDFQYNNKATTNLQGAADFIGNASLTYSDNKENPFTATVTANYSSDKIYALGSPEDKENSHIYFNNEIMEKGFTTIDMILTKKFSKRISMKLSAKNLLNPSIEQTQEIKSFITDEITNETISSYKKGISVNLGLKINLN